MKDAKNYMVTALGIVLMAAGLFFLKTTDGSQGFLRALPYVCIGIGSGALGHGIGELFNERTLRKNPALRRQDEINKKDERNIAISDRAKAKAYNLMVFVFRELMLAFVLMGVEMLPVLLLVAAYLYVEGYAIYCRCKYEKEM